MSEDKISHPTIGIALALLAATLLSQEAPRKREPPA